jgi:very-short-patch-repair endonuclease
MAAGKQWGNVTAAQLRSLGFTRNDIAGMVRRSALLRVHRGVYAVGHRSPAPEARWSAALLAAGARSALSHTAAAAARQLMTPRAVTEVTAPAERRGDARLRVHHAALPEEEVVLHAGLRIVSVPRMLLELAGANWPIDRMAHEAAASGLADLEVLRAWAAQHRPTAGIVALRRALALSHTRSGGERQLEAFLRRQGVSDFEMNARIGRLSVDAHLPGLGIAIELDPEQTHGSAEAIRRDAWRDRYLRARGVEPLRVDLADLSVLAEELRNRSAA